MLIRRYLFIEGSYRGTAKISPQGSDRILVEVMVDTVVQEEIKAYLTGKEGGLSFCVGVCKKEGNKMRLSEVFREKQLTEKHINPEECGCIVLSSLIENKDNKNNTEMKADNIDKAVKADQINGEDKAQGDLYQGKFGLVREIAPDLIVHSAQATGKIKKIPSFEESFSCSYGLRWRTCTFDDMPPGNELISAVLLNQGAIECINQFGGFYFGEREEDIQVIGIPARIGKDPLPCLNIFRTLSYLKEKNEKFGCYMIGLNQKLGVLFPAIFE